MKCYYQIGDGEWMKGQATSMHGGNAVNFHSEHHQITLYNPEVLFHSLGMAITGYVPERGGPGGQDNVYKLVSLEVRWTKPRS